MVGEIRDSETAKIAIEAALTGHLVLSTLHTNDAPGALTRLNEMGVEPFLTGSAVSAVLAQRLARKLCTHCCEMYTPTSRSWSRRGSRPTSPPRRRAWSLYRKRRLPALQPDRLQGPDRRSSSCSSMNDELESSRRGTRRATRSSAPRCGAGMRTLWDDGMAKVAAGLTSIEELARVVSA